MDDDVRNYRRFASLDTEKGSYSILVDKDGMGVKNMMSAIAVMGYDPNGTGNLQYMYPESFMVFHPGTKVPLARFSFDVYNIYQPSDLPKRE